MTHVTLPDERKKAKKGKKRKANDEDSKAAVLESDVVTEKAKGKAKKKKSEAEDLEEAVVKSDVVTEKAKRKSKKKKKSKAESSEEVNTSQQEKPPVAEVENGSDGEKDLSPEEKRVLERKLKKIRKKEEKKKLREEGKSMEGGKSVKKDKVQTGVGQKAALEYLTRWSEKREEWKFLKTRQTWLLQNMYDTSKVSDDHFKVLLAYMENLRGASRATTLKKAEAIVRWEGQGEAEDTEEAEKKKQRAKQVVQLL